MEKLIKIFTIVLGIGFSSAYGQLVVDNTTLTPEQLVQQILVGQGVTISNVQFNGSNPNAQIVQQQVGEFDGANSNVGLNAGVILATGNASLAEGPNSSGSAGNSVSLNNSTDPDLNAISSNTVNDWAILEFDFVPQGDTVRFEYVFGSDEYEEFSFSNYNDIFGFFISGPGINGTYLNNAENIALIPGTTTPVTINNLNQTNNNSFYTPNAGGASVEYDGFTVVMEAVSEVQCGQTYHIKIAIADAGDHSYDSGVFLKANSFSSQGIDVSVQTVTGDTTIVEGCGGATFIFSRPEDDVANPLTVNFDISGTATNGTDYNNVNSQVTFPAGEDSVSITINPVQDGITEGPESIIFTTYIVNACGDTIESEGTIWIVDALPVNIVMNDTTITCPTPLIPIVPVITSGVPQYTYDWSDGSTNDTLWVPGDQSGTYTLEVTDNCGVTGNESVTVTYIAPTPLDIVFNSNTFNLCPSQSATITANNVVNAQGNVTYNWSTGDNTQSTTASPIAGQPETWIYLTVEDDCISAIDSVKLVLGDVQIDDITVVDASDCMPLIAVPDGEIHITTTPSGGVTFDISGGGFTDNNMTGDFVALNGGVNYFITATDANGCSSDTVVFVDNLNNPTTFNGPTNIVDIDCFGAGNGAAEITNINGGATGAPYDVIWENTDGTTINETVNTAGGGDAQNTLHGGQWTVTVLDAGGCAMSQVFDIVEPDELIVDIDVNSVVICHDESNGSIDMSPSGGTGNPGTYDIQWSNGATTEDIDQIPGGTYTVTVTDDNGCVATNSITLNNPAEIDVQLVTTDATCFGNDFGSVQVNVIEAQGSNTDWNYIYSPINYTTQDPNLGHLYAGPYTMQFFDSAGCNVIIPFNIGEPAPITFDVVEDPSLCRANGLYPGNGSVSATNVQGGVGSYSYTWTSATDTVYTPTWGGIPGGTYVIAINDGNNCVVSDTVQLDSLNPDAAFTIDPVWGIAPLNNIDIENTSQNVTQNASYTWSFENWQYATQDYGYAPDTSLLNPGSYQVCLTVTNVYQCVDSTCMDIRVVPPLTITPPNIFTPNGDGVNDVLHFSVDGATSFHCEVFNRWGQMIYSWDDGSLGWDGNNQGGNPMPSGNYFYQYSVTGEDGTSQSGQGHVQLVRD